jgi:hypothetical protein
MLHSSCSQSHPALETCENGSATGRLATFGNPKEKDPLDLGGWRLGGRVQEATCDVKRGRGGRGGSGRSMGSSSPQRVDDGRMPHVFSQLQGGFSVTNIESMHVRAPSHQPLQTRQMAIVSCLVNRSLTPPAATSMRHCPSLSQHNTQPQPRQPITTASNNQHPQHSSSTLNKTQHATIISINAIDSIAATSGNVVALINSTHLL